MRCALPCHALPCAAPCLMPYPAPCPAPAATRARGRSTACVFNSVQSSVGSWLLGGALAALLPSFRHYALTLTLPFARQRLAEKTCDDTDGSSTAAVCGTGATCSEGVTGDGYKCECDVAGYSGADVSNGAATCTGEQCFVARSAACSHSTACVFPVAAAARPRYRSQMYMLTPRCRQMFQYSNSPRPWRTASALSPLTHTSHCPRPPCYLQVQSKLVPAHPALRPSALAKLHSAAF